MDDSNTSSSKKRKRSTKNPLAKARGKQQSHSNVWFKRSGAGPILFVEYYSQQPVGTVGDSLEHGDRVHGKNKDGNGKELPVNYGSDSANPTKNKSNGTTTGAGLSRAAKRRKKKKGGTDGNLFSTATTTTSQESSSPATTKTTPVISTKASRPNSNHPLLQAMTKLSAKQKSALPVEDFLLAMSKPLPVTFRLRRTLSPTTTKELQERLSHEFKTTVQPLPFGNDLLYQVTNCSKAQLSKEAPLVKDFLVDGSLDGKLARQELGSILPVLALECAGAFSQSSNSKKSHRRRVLDVCASPGSKTLQAIELLHCRHKNQQDDNHNKNSKSMSRILANDVSEARLTALREAMERSGVPLYYHEKNDDGSNHHNNQKSIVGYSCQDARHLSTQKLWDVIICDVP